MPLDGKDAWPTIAEGKPSPHEDILLNTTPNSGAIRAGDWKLVVNAARTTRITGREEGQGADGAVQPEGRPVREDQPRRQAPGRVKELRARLDGYAKQAVAPKVQPRPKDFVAPKVWGEKN